MLCNFRVQHAIFCIGEFPQFTILTLYIGAYFDGCMFINNYCNSLWSIIQIKYSTEVDRYWGIICDVGTNDLYLLNWLI